MVTAPIGDTDFSENCKKYIPINFLFIGSARQYGTCVLYHAGLQP
jgi:hypothetical protein